VPEDPALATPADGRKPWILSGSFDVDAHRRATRTRRDATRRDANVANARPVDAVEDLARADARTRRESRRRE
jgi:hypothetical protein